MLSVDIAHITFIRYDSASEDQHVAMWPPGQQFIRRHTSPTSLGTPQPFRRIIAAG